MKKEIEQKLIDFEGGAILGFRTEDNKVWMGVKKACVDIGLTDGQARRQVENIQEDLALKSKYRKFAMVQNEGDRKVNREIIALNEDVVTLWLAKISLTPKMQRESPKAVQKLINYQLKAGKVLHNAFMATEEQKQELFNSLGLEGKIVDMEQKLDTTINRLDTLIDNSTINSRQAQKLLFAAKDKVNTMLDGAHSKKYKKESRVYFKNLWMDFCEKFETSSYKDLNPVNYNEGFTFINNWSFM